MRVAGFNILIEVPGRRQSLCSLPLTAPPATDLVAGQLFKPVTVSISVLRRFGPPGCANVGRRHVLVGGKRRRGR